MKTFARVHDGAVAELISTGVDIASLYNPAIAWVDVTGIATIGIGWLHAANGGFTAPLPAVAPQGAEVSGVSIASLQAQVTALRNELAALSGGSGATGGGSGAGAASG